MVYNYYKQFRTVLILEIFLVFFAISFARFFWSHICDQSVVSCLKDTSLNEFKFLMLSVVRPFVFTPMSLFSMMSGYTFGLHGGVFFGALGAVLSTAALYFFSKAFGQKLVRPWLSSNLPETLKFIKSQDWKVILLLRVIPIIPFDLATIIFGFLDFRLRTVMIATFIGILPEVYIFSELGLSHSYGSVLWVSVKSLIFVFFFLGLPALVYEYNARRFGSGLIPRSRAMWKEIQKEMRLNNALRRRQEHDPAKKPVLLMYGFFSSRRVLTIQERILSKKGYEVFSFNLGGLFGIFFTHGIPYAANYINQKLMKQLQQYDVPKVSIVAHSKGGLVASWWLLALGGHRYCDKLITLGTPFKGSLWTWLGLLSPIGFFFKDLGQMRPGSVFLKELHKLKVPSHVTIYNLYSRKDHVSRGAGGIFQPIEGKDRVVPIPMNHLSHYEFLYKKEVCETLASILGSPYGTDS
jgi:triacylglycerol lipase